ncbi:phage tail tape measure protein [Salaquimonas pukyongi]|uniref:phage tail tape measure protein n=1 Tax=Salaquimonas pukyongi TaxID=2712698 RepID=UPI00096BAC03|nr:phage tail tape measure protein [Salaquimonas pukyongi]
MANREIEARLKLSAKDNTAAAFRSVSKNLDSVNRQAAAYNKSQRDTARNFVAFGRAAVATTAAMTVASVSAYKKFSGDERTLTRIGNKLDANRDQMRDLGDQIFEVARRWSLSQEEVIGTVDAMAESGMELDEIRTRMDALAKSQQAIGASGQQIANTFDAARKSLGIAGGEAERFFDIIAAGGAAGKFEASDLATYLPSLAPIAGNLGFEGLEGTERIVALLETMRDFTGGSQQAANGFRDFMEKITSPAVQKSFSKLGINLETELTKAQEAGERIELTMHRLIRRATGDDATKLSQLFGEVDSRNFARVLLQQMDEIEKRVDTIRSKSKGMIDANVKAVLEDNQAALDRMMASISQLSSNVGAFVAPAITGGVDAINESIDYHSAIAKAHKEMGLSSWDRLASGLYSNAYKDRMARIGGYAPDEVAKLARDRNRQAYELLGRNPIRPGQNKSGEAALPRTPQDVIDNYESNERYFRRHQTQRDLARAEGSATPLPSPGSGRYARQHARRSTDFAPIDLDDESIQIEVDAETSAADAAVDDFTRRAEKTVVVKVDADTSAAEAKMRALEKRRAALNRSLGFAGPGSSSTARSLGTTMPDAGKKK